MEQLKGKSFKVVLVICFCGLAEAAMHSFSPLDNELPIDEIEAREFLDAGYLDSTLLYRLLPLYRRPLQVPTGEAVELLDLFPELAGSFPVDEKTLDTYQPWDAAAQQRFLADYPVMRRLLPLLNFDYHQTRFNSSTSFFMNRASASGASGNHSARFTVAPQSGFVLRGTVDATDDYARWERRVLAVQPAPWIRMEAGNITRTDDHGLFFGYFPERPITERDETANWLYGSARSWNGAMVELSGKGWWKPEILTPSLTGFLHVRPSETAAGGTMTVTGKKRSILSCGISRLEVDSADAGELYLHSSLSVVHKRMRSDLFCGVSLSGKVLVPFIWKGTMAADGYRTQMSITRLPCGFTAPRSALLQQFSSEFDVPDTLPAPITLARLSVNRESGRHFTTGPRAELWFEGGAINHATAQWLASMEFDRCEGRLLLSADLPGTIGSGAGGSLQGSCSWVPAPVLKVASYHRMSISKRGRNRYRGSVSPVLTLLSCLHIEPTLSLITETGHHPRYLAGVRQQMVLFEQTHTEFYIERQLDAGQTGNQMRVEGRASFYF
jgi:hypothetical protein